MFHASEILSLFEPAVGSAESGSILYEILLKPTRPFPGESARSSRLFKALEEGQARGGYQLEGLIHWPAGLLIRVRLPHSRGLHDLVEFLQVQTSPPHFDRGFWETEPTSLRLIQPGAEESPVNSFDRQMDRIRQSLGPAPLPSVGWFYFHKSFRDKVLPAA